MCIGQTVVWETNIFNHYYACHLLVTAVCSKLCLLLVDELAHTVCFVCLCG